jgi:hypothetical protein
MSRIERGFHDSVNDRGDRAYATRNTMPYRGAIFAKVTSPDGDSERVTIDTLTGDKKTSFVYPFSTPNAWIRGQPENGTTMIAMVGADTKDIQPMGYFDPTKSGVARTYRSLVAGVRQNPSSTIPNRATAYRTLAPGEIDLASNHAQAFFGMRDVAQVRGGLSHHTMTSLYTKMQTPMLQVEGPHHVLSGNLQDELRYGTVRRSKTGSSNPTLPELIKGDGVRRFTAPGDPLAPLFAKEFSVLVDWLGDPAKLIDHRQGIVTDDDGTFPKGGPRRKPLRARYQWFTTAGLPGTLNYSTAELDEGGNVLFQTSQDATDGVAIAIPDGDFVMNVGETRGGQWSVTATGDSQINVKQGARFAIVADGGFRINTPQRGEIKADQGLGLKSDGIINIDAAPASGITLGKRSGTKYPVLVAHPEYLSTLSSYYSSQSSLSSSLATAAGNAAAAWSAVGPLLMLLDPSGTVMGTCLSAAAGMTTVASTAPTVATAIGQHLPKLARMPSGFVSAKTVSQ